MMLGTDVSSLSTTAANAAAKGLSIVVPLYNEAVGLASLHQRLCALARNNRVKPAPPQPVAEHGRVWRIEFAVGIRQSAAQAGAEVLEWPSSHSPFLSHPDLVADLVARRAERASG